MSSTSTIALGRLSQALAFSGASSSYFQGSGLTSLGFNNQPFSISLWIQPQLLSGTLVHLSSSPNGVGTNCFPLLGFSSTGAIIAQVLTATATLATATGPILPISSSAWVPIAQTWSATNGLRLYVNGTLTSSIAASTFLGSGTTPNYLTLGGCLSGCMACSNGQIGVPGPYTGALDDVRVYLRELSSIDVCTLLATAWLYSICSRLNKVFSWWSRSSSRFFLRYILITTHHEANIKCWWLIERRCYSSVP